MNIFAVATGIVTLFVILTIASFSLDGNAGIAATQLNGAITESDATITVDSTEGFLDIDYIIVQDEFICYTGRTATTFTGATRGCHGTDESSHEDDVAVYNEASGTVNQLIGFNIAEAETTVGSIKVALGLAGAIPRAFAKIVLWDYSYLEGSFWGWPLVYIKFIAFYPFSAAFVIGLFIVLINVFMGVARLVP